jgi:hypothetical protein
MLKNIFDTPIYSVDIQRKTFSFICTASSNFERSHLTDHITHATKFQYIINAMYTKI